MKAATAVAKILKREGVEFLIGYPVNQIIEAAAEADIRTIIVRQERTGLHMADAVSRITSGQRIGVFAMQHGPGTENAFGGVAQAFGDSVPIVVLPGGYPRKLLNIPPNFSSLLNFQHVTKWCEQVILPESIPDAMRRAFTQVKNGRPRPVLVEIPVDVMRAEEVPDDFVYTPTPRLRMAPDPQSVTALAAALVAAKRPVIYAGQGVHYARAWKQLRELAELLEAPVTTSPAGQERVPGEPPAVARLGRPLDHASSSTTSCTTPTSSSASAAASPRPTTAWPCPRASASRTPRSTRSTSTRTCVAEHRAGRRRRAHARGADRRGKDRLKGKPRGRMAAVTKEIATLKQRVAGAVDAAAHAEDVAAVALSRAVGPDAHRGRGQHHHHPRRRQPAGPDLAVLGADRAADLHRLGQDDPARLRPRPGHGRQAGQSREALRQLLGRRRHRLHRHGLRDRGARAHPDPVGAARTTSRWPSS